MSDSVPLPGDGIAQAKEDDRFEQAMADEQFMERVARAMPEFKRDEMTFRERQLGRALIAAVRASVHAPQDDPEASA